MVKLCCSAAAVAMLGILGEIQGQDGKVISFNDEGILKQMEISGKVSIDKEFKGEGSSAASLKIEPGDTEPLRPPPPPADLALVPPPQNQTATPYAKWERGFEKDPNYFPIAVWLQNPANAKAYKELGINLYMALWDGPDEAQLAALKEAGMRVICTQNEVGLKHIADPNIVAWMHGDEPDNAQPFKTYWKENVEKIKEGWPEVEAFKNLGPANPYNGYGPSIPPKWIIRDYNEIKKRDPSRPVILNLGQGVAWNGWEGRGERTGKLEDYIEYTKGCDIVSFDIYPVVTEGEIAGSLWYVPKGVSRLRKWTLDEKPVWNCIECTRIGNAGVKPTPQQVRTEVWMSIIHGSRGLIYFVHQFAPTFVEAALLADKEMSAAVAAINKQIKELAPVINSPTIADAVAVTSSDPHTPVHAIVKKHGDSTYVFAVSMYKRNTKASLQIKGLPKAATAEVLGESRTLPVADGLLQDDFAGYAVHLYRVK